MRPKNTHKSLTIIVPAFNEEAHLENTVNGILKIANKTLDDYELIIFDDGSSDNTLNIANLIKGNNSKIRVIHHEIPKDLSYIFKEGIRLSNKENIILLPGDGAFSESSISEVFQSIGAAEMILTNRVNQKAARSFFRYSLSKVFYHVNKLLFDLKTDDINTIGVFPIHYLRLINLSATNKAFNLEILVKLKRFGLNHKSIDVQLNPERHFIGKSFNTKFIIDSLKIMFQLLFKT